jgi:hypothetical protein
MHNRQIYNKDRLWRVKGELKNMLFPIPQLVKSIRRYRSLIEKGAVEPLIWLKGQIPEVEAEPSIEKDMCSHIIDSKTLAYKGKKGLRFETPEARITK